MNLCQKPAWNVITAELLHYTGVLIAARCLPKITQKQKGHEKITKMCILYFEYILIIMQCSFFT